MKEEILTKQEKADKIRHELMSNLADESVARYKLVEEYVHKLAEQKIPAYIFAMLPIPMKLSNGDKVEGRQIFQYNTVTSFLEFDSDGKILESSIDDLYHFSMQYILSQLELYKSNTGHAQSRGVRELDLYDNLEIIADNYCDYIKTNVSHINANRQ